MGWVRMRDFGRLPCDPVNLCDAPLACVDVFFGEAGCGSLATLPFHEDAIASTVEFVGCGSATFLPQ
jgi:hypothetical protein